MVNSTTLVLVHPPASKSKSSSTLSASVQPLLGEIKPLVKRERCHSVDTLSGSGRHLPRIILIYKAQSSPDDRELDSSAHFCCTGVQPQPIRLLRTPPPPINRSIAERN